MAEIEAAFKRIGNYRDVMGVVIIGKEREVIRTNVSVSSAACGVAGGRAGGQGEPRPPRRGIVIG